MILVLKFLVSCQCNVSNIYVISNLIIIYLFQLPLSIFLIVLVDNVKVK